MTQISEAFKKEPRSISTFRKGDLIIRTEPAIRRLKTWNENLGVEMVIVEQVVDESFRTTPLEFICIENQVIYCKSFSPGLEGWVVKLLLDNYAEGWA